MVLKTIFTKWDNLVKKSDGREGAYCLAPIIECLEQRFSITERLKG